MEKKFNFKTRQIGFVNWLGAWTLLVREVSRFIKVYSQTIVAPVVTTMMFFIIFSVVIKRGTFITDNITDFSQFLAAGLIMMAMLQNAFANTSSSLVISKIQGNIVDILMPPLTAGELTFSYAIGGVVRGFVVGISVFFVINWFVGFETFHFGFIIFYIFFSSLALSLLGIIGGIWSEKFDHIAAVTNFVVTPLTFLSGTFYSVHRLPEDWSYFAQFNPIFYMVDGFRYGLTGYADGNLLYGLVYILSLNIILWLIAYSMFSTGYTLKT